LNIFQEVLIEITILRFICFFFLEKHCYIFNT
jgi:hypothetical protein